MPPPRIPDMVLRDVRLIWRNFTGTEGKMNAAGSRNFSVVLDPEIATAMRADGWNVKTKPARDETEDELNTVQVQVSYKTRPPKICLISSKGRTYLGEGEVDMLDYADIQKVDVVLHPYEWEIRNEVGVKAYLKTAFITIAEDPLELEYEGVGSLPPVAVEDD